ncbi:MAG: LuxR C-terminal-related transcriptional regulator [Spirochaetaceae bacterium]
MYFPSSLDVGERLLCLYHTKTERMRAVLHYVLRGVERDERLLTVLDRVTTQTVEVLCGYVDPRSEGLWRRSVHAESFVDEAPLEPADIAARISRGITGWRGRRSQRPVRVILDVHYLLVSLCRPRDAVELSRLLRGLAAELPVIFVCLLFMEHVPRTGLRSFLNGFSRIVSLCAAEHGRRRECSEELDAALDRLVLSDERAYVEGAIRCPDARTFLHIAPDAFLIVDRVLRVRYASPNLTRALSVAVQSGTPLSGILRATDYRRVEAGLRRLAESGCGPWEPTSVSLLRLAFRSKAGEPVEFEASVAPVVSARHFFGYICILRPLAAEGTSGAAAPKREADRADRCADEWLSVPREVTACARVSRREREVLELTVNGMSTARIAERLSIALTTVKKHRTNAYQKLGIRDRFDLLRLSQVG